MLPRAAVTGSNLTTACSGRANRVLFHYQRLVRAADAWRASPSLRVTNVQTSSKTSIWLFLITFALVFYGMGASFVESFVNYPTWRLIGANEFRSYHQALGPLVIGYMVIPMLITTILTLLLLWFRPPPIPRWAIWLAVVLQLMTWVSTAAVQFPIQVQLSRDGLSLPLIERLIFTNWWLRKVPQIINVLLFVWLMSLLLKVNSHHRAEA
jgi:hypothetical protein